MVPHSSASAPSTEAAPAVRQRSCGSRRPTTNAGSPVIPDPALITASVLFLSNIFSTDFQAAVSADGGVGSLLAIFAADPQRWWQHKIERCFGCQRRPHRAVIYNPCNPWGQVTCVGVKARIRRQTLVPPRPRVGSLRHTPLGPTGLPARGRPFRLAVSAALGLEPNGRRRRRPSTSTQPRSRRNWCLPGGGEALADAGPDLPREKNRSAGWTDHRWTTGTGRGRAPALTSFHELEHTPWVIARHVRCSA